MSSKRQFSNFLFHLLKQIYSVLKTVYIFNNHIHLLYRIYTEYIWTYIYLHILPIRKVHIHTFYKDFYQLEIVITKQRICTLWGFKEHICTACLTYTMTYITIMVYSNRNKQYKYAFQSCEANDSLAYSISFTKTNFPSLKNCIHIQ